MLTQMSCVSFKLKLKLSFEQPSCILPKNNIILFKKVFKRYASIFSINQPATLKTKNTSFVLNLSSLNDLIASKVLAISVKQFFPSELCKEVSKKIFSEKYEYYDYAQQSVGRYGMSFSEIANETKFNEYYKRSVNEIEVIRSIFHPFLSPIDHLRLRLDELWPVGAKIEQVHKNQKMFVGLLRVIDPNKIVYPHQDMIAWNAYQCEKNAVKIQKQLAANIYFQVPKNGGELELWDFGIKKMSVYNKLAGDSYGINKDKLPSPTLTLKPEEGELILFNPQNLHCILPGSSHRLTQSCFIGYRNNKNSLTFWS